ncbi:hypothetical protein BIFDEN_01260 [Bifidobacterium dentium ATCC 27678]|nr:hypothetical protein BIFDEN_01260 [Bifidobacterium dentium ATCC 27678]
MLIGGEASPFCGFPARTEYSEANYRKECKHLKVCDDARPCGRTQGRHMPMQERIRGIPYAEQ